MNFMFIFGVLIKGSFCDWVSEWLVPLEHQYKELLTRNTKNLTMELLPAGETSDVVHLNKFLQTDNVNTNDKILSPFIDNISSRSLKLKVEETLKTAQALIITLRRQIKEIEVQEGLLKEAIVNGRSGVTTLTVSALGLPARTYIIRDGFWTLCNGIFQYPANYNIFTELFSAPRCVGQEVPSERDPCVFNSIIKYEIIPKARRPTYFEEDILCLRPSFNNTLESFLSVPKKVVAETCTNGVIKRLIDNIQDCGVRVLSEYTYYPNKEATSILPFEYCTEKDGSCKLMVAWHLSNETVENFEFFNSDQNFKKFFIKSNSVIQSFI